MAKRKKAKATAKRRATAKKATTAKKRTTAKATRKTAKATTKRTTAKKATTAKKRKPNAAFMSPMTPSPALAVIVGGKPLPRTQVVKKIWAYIKKRKLQDPKNRRNICADANLQAVFQGKKVVSMFEMTKLVNKNLKKAA